jgi:hypothetical protein
MWAQNPRGYRYLTKAWGWGGPPLPQRGIVAAQMQAVAQVADLVVALDELLAQPLDLLRGVTNKLGVGITANADTTSPV